MGDVANRGEYGEVSTTPVMKKAYHEFSSAQKVNGGGGRNNEMVKSSASQYSLTLSKISTTVKGPFEEIK